MGLTGASGAIGPTGATGATGATAQAGPASARFQYLPDGVGNTASPIACSGKPGNKFNIKPC